MKHSLLHDLATCSENRLFGVALASRVALLALMVLCDWVVPDYDSCSSLQLMPLRAPKPLAAAQWMERRSGPPARNANVTAQELRLAAEEGALWRSQWMPFVNHWDGVHFTHIGRYGYTHENVCAFFGFVPVAIIGQFGEFLASLHASSRPAVAALLPSASTFASILSIVFARGNHTNSPSPGPPPVKLRPKSQYKEDGCDVHGI